MLSPTTWLAGTSTLLKPKVALVQEMEVLVLAALIRLRRYLIECPKEYSLVLSFVPRIQTEKASMSSLLFQIPKVFANI